MQARQRREAFRQKVQSRAALLVPGACNALSARVIEDLGFEALHLSGAGVTNMALGLPDKVPSGSALPPNRIRGWLLPPRLQKVST